MSTSSTSAVARAMSDIAGELLDGLTAEQRAVATSRQNSAQLQTFPFLQMTSAESGSTHPPIMVASHCIHFLPHNTDS
ncbi:MAG: hypothetical protein RLZ84_1573 [Actinomycetota bacterium]